MQAEILSIGSELTSGQNLDTNCQWLSRRLAEIGVPVAFHTTVADDMADNVACFALATQRADLVISTGGLGPTQDDLTREVIAAVEKVSGKRVPARETDRRAGDPPELVADARLAAEVLGWKARLPNIETIVEHAWRWRQKRKER